MKKIKNKKVFKLVILFVITVLCIIIFSTKSNANSLQSLKMNISIDDNGNARISEVWNMRLDEGTEVYRPYLNLDNSKVQNLRVIDENGNTFQNLEIWNPNDTFNNKKYKSGINNVSNGVELCWGISEYGTKKYFVTYEVTNFVRECSDSQYVYFNLFPSNFSIDVNSVIINIKSNKLFNNENSKIWSFGYPNGDIQFNNGIITMNSQGTLPSNNYMTALIKIDNKFFTPSVKIEKKFEDIYNEAMSDINNRKKILTIIFTIGGIILLIIIIYIVSSIIKGIIKKIKRFCNFMSEKIFRFRNKHYIRIEYENGKQLPNIKDIPYERSVPCGGNILKAYWIAVNYGIIKEKEQSNLIGVVLLRWIKQGKIKVIQEESGLFNSQKYKLDFNYIELNETDSEIEKILLHMCKDASNIKPDGTIYINDNIEDKFMLESKEFEIYCTKYCEKVLGFFNTAINSGYGVLAKENKIIIQEREYTKFLELQHIKESVTVYTNDLREEAIRILGFKKFLLDYSLIATRETQEVEMWNGFLIFAQLLGIADKVEKQFIDIYPEYDQIIKINNNNISSVLSEISYNSFDIAKDSYEEKIKREKELEERRIRELNRSSYTNNETRDSGGGGSSYSGGGTSATGHSSGGGVR